MSEIFELLEREDKRQLSELAALDRIARGSRHGPVAAEESKIPYELPRPPEWACAPPASSRRPPKQDPIDADEAAASWAAARASREAQLAALGVPPPSPSTSEGRNP